MVCVVRFVVDGVGKKKGGVIRVGSWVPGWVWGWGSYTRRRQPQKFATRLQESRGVFGNRVARYVQLASKNFYKKWGLCLRESCGETIKKQAPNFADMLVQNLCALW